MLRIRLLGGVELAQDGARLPPLESGRAESLLAHLLLHRDAPVARQHLAPVLWPDTTDAQARTNLRHVLHTLRRALPDADALLDVTPRTLQWRADAAYELDVAAFDAALGRAAVLDGETALGPLREAVVLYRGDLVPGAADDWLVTARAELRLRWLSALRRVVELLEASPGAEEDLVVAAERLRRADPVDEEVARLLMRTYAARGEGGRALRVHADLAGALDAELGAPPSPQTQRVRDGLLAQEDDDAGDDAEVAPALVGRTAERALLAGLWRAAEEGGTRLVVVTGEAGVGKTRLVEELRAWCVARGAVAAAARSYAAEGAPAYAPVVAWLRTPALRRRLERLDRVRLAELSRLLPELIVDLPEAARPLPLPPADARGRLFDAVAEALLADERPLLLVADDLQWADRETLALLHFLLRTVTGRPLLVVATVREEDVATGSGLPALQRGLQAQDALTEVRLEPLTRTDVAALAEQVAGSPLPTGDVDRLWRETGGNALFVVETLRAGAAGGGPPSSRVSAVIEGRLAELSPDAAVLVGTAATVGRDATVDLLARAAGLDEAAFDAALDELWRRRVVRHLGGTTYDVSHDVVRTVAYDRLGPVRRRRHHLAVARALEAESLEAGAGDDAAAQVAAHYDRGGAASAAADWYLRAAPAAQRVHADEEAVRLLDRALEVLRTSPPGHDRDARELAVLAALPAPLVALEGYASPRLSDVHARGLVLADALGSPPPAPLLRSLAFAALTAEEFARTTTYARELRAAGQRAGDDVLVVEGATMLGLAAFWQGDLETARHELEEAVRRYRSEDRERHLLAYGQDPVVVALARLGNVAALRGAATAAVEASEAALAAAGEHPFSRGAALLFGALAALDLDDAALVRARTEALVAIGIKAAPVRLSAAALRGYVAVLDGRAAEGLAATMQAAAEARDQTPAPGLRAMVGRVLLAACSAAGDARTGLAATDDYLALGGAAVVWEPLARTLRDRFAAAVAATGGDRGTLPERPPEQPGP